jgi:hypothetical protein
MSAYDPKQTLMPRRNGRFILSQRQYASWTAEYWGDLFIVLIYGRFP